VIGLNKAFMADKPRLRFTAAHELGHLLLLLPHGLTAKEIEHACHRFASAFLIPREPFIQAFGQQRSQIAWAELNAMKSRWGMSVAAIMKRAHQLGLISDSRYKSFCFIYRKNGSAERDVWQGSEDSTRFKQLVYRGLSEGLISQSKAGALLGITQRKLAADFDILTMGDE
jgi:Zn-dependent peptidase ImmA (M78 family)